MYTSLQIQHADRLFRQIIQDLTLPPEDFHLSIPSRNPDSHFALGLDHP